MGACRNIPPACNVTVTKVIDIDTSLSQLGVAALLLVAVLRGAPAGAGAGQAAFPPLAKGWGWFLVSGTATGVDPSARTITVAVTGEGRAEILEGGAAWRPKSVTGTQVVQVLPATVLADADDAPVSIAAIRAGTPLLVWGVVRSDASSLGLKVLMTRLHARPVPALSIGAPSG